MADTSNAASLITGGGRIVVQRNNSPWRLEPGEYVYPNEVITTGDDGWGMFKVSDGSTFENNTAGNRGGGNSWVAKPLLSLRIAGECICAELQGGQIRALADRLADQRIDIRVDWLRQRFVSQEEWLVALVTHGC